MTTKKKTKKIKPPSKDHQEIVTRLDEIIAMLQAHAGPMTPVPAPPPAAA